MNPYLPNPAVIDEVIEATYDTKIFRLHFKEKKVRDEFEHKPGQFVELSIFGYGEAPISITSPPIEKEHLELCVRSVGAVTNALHSMKEGDLVSIRGPYGNGFPLEETKGKNLLFIAGGIGLPPLRSLIGCIPEKREDFMGVKILYGARTSSDLLYMDELKRWGKMEDTEVLITVDNDDEEWKGNVGVVTTLFEKTKISPDNTVALMCGPEIMMRFVVKDLLKFGFPEEEIILSLERKMQCGIGKCGHCNIAERYVCLDGPVFRYDQIKGIPGVL
jgi:sulfite reductase subunit B